MKFVDYYKIMGLDDSASEADIKKAYRKLARQYHPDVSKEPDAEQRFKDIGEAYSVLKDPERKREYDELKRTGGVQGHDFKPPPGWQSHAGFDPEDFGSQGAAQDAAQGAAEFSDFFEHIFGNRSWQRTSQHSEGNFAARGQDMHTHLSVSLQDAFHGSTLPVSFQVPAYHPDGSIASESKTLQIKIPKGVTSGQKIRLRGQGGPAVGDAPPGDLYIELDIQDNKQYHLDGKNVTVNLPLAPWEAALGASVDVPTLGGTVKLTIPANAKSGQKMRLKGRGLPGEPPGDQFVMLTIVLPEATTDEQRAHYQQMSDLWSFNPRQKTGG